MNSSDRLVGSPSPQSVESFQKARLVRKCGALWLPPMGSGESSRSFGAVSARHGQVRVLQKAARRYLRCARRPANWITLRSRCCSNTSSSLLCVRVGVRFGITYFLSVFLVRRLSFTGFAGSCLLDLGPIRNQ